MRILLDFPNFVYNRLESVISNVVLLIGLSINIMIVNGNSIISSQYSFQMLSYLLAIRHDSIFSLHNKYKNKLLR